jgi:hypothetical protein
MRQRRRPLRGFFAGLLLGIFVDLDLALSGAVKLDSVVLTILPVALIVLGLILGIWTPVGRGKEPASRLASPLPPPVAWPESAATEGSNSPTSDAQWTAPPPLTPPSAAPTAPPTTESSESPPAST